MRKVRHDAKRRQELIQDLFRLSFVDSQSTACRRLFTHAAEVVTDLDRRNRQLRRALGDFADYFEPRGGVSDVPSGPFHRAAETLGVHSVGTVSSSELKDQILAAAHDTEE